MKRTALLLILLAIPLAAHAQTITLGPIAKTAYCVGDTMFVPYTATGTFNPGNYFFAELSDASGSFASFTPFGNSNSASGTIAVPILAIGDHFRVRAASSEPYTISTDNTADVIVSRIPSPMPSILGPPWSNPQYYGYGLLHLPPYAGLIDDTILLAEGNHDEPGGSTYLWKFAADANIQVSSVERTKVVYSTPGLKSSTLMVQSPAGCVDTVVFAFNVLTCNPTIPASAHVVRTSESGSFPIVWVKTGGSYTANSSVPTSQVIFAESGSSVTVVGLLGGENLYYLKRGVSVTYSNPSGSVLVLDSSMNVSIPYPFDQVDTFYCDNLTFDYSQVSGGVAEEAQPAAPRISQSGERLFVSAEDAAFSVHVVNVLGNEIASMDGRGTLELDLTQLPAGIYFAIAQAGHERTVKRIAVVH